MGKSGFWEKLKAWSDKTGYWERRVFGIVVLAIVLFTVFSPVFAYGTISPRTAIGHLRFELNVEVVNEYQKAFPNRVRWERMISTLYSNRSKIIQEAEKDFEGNIFSAYFSFLIGKYFRREKAKSHLADGMITSMKKHANISLPNLYK